MSPPTACRGIADHRVSRPLLAPARRTLRRTRQRARRRAGAGAAGAGDLGRPEPGRAWAALRGSVPSLRRDLRGAAPADPPRLPCRGAAPPQTRGRAADLDGAGVAGRDARTRRRDGAERSRGGRRRDAVDRAGRRDGCRHGRVGRGGGHHGPRAGAAVLASRLVERGPRQRAHRRRRGAARWRGGDGRDRGGGGASPAGWRRAADHRGGCRLRRAPDRQDRGPRAAVRLSRHLAAAGGDAGGSRRRARRRLGFRARYPDAAHHRCGRAGLRWIPGECADARGCGRALDRGGDVLAPRAARLWRDPFPCR